MNINKKCLNYLRSLSCEMITNANSGHPGIALGATEIMYALFKDHYLYDVKDHNFFARDRFVLSAGHASSLYYACAHMFNFGLNSDDLKSFRQLDSITPGHPEFGNTNFVEASTGPLGQGIANAVGMAIGQSMLAKKFNAQGYPVFNNYTYCLCGDGCLMEGVGQEALSLAGTLKLDKFILLYDYNNITIDGKAEIANNEDIVKKFKAMNFNVIYVYDGNCYEKVTKAIAKAKRCKNKPTAIIFKTTIGLETKYAGLNQIHGNPLKPDELNELKKHLEIETSFELPQDIKNYAILTNKKNNLLIEKWNNMFAVYQKSNPELYKQLISFMEDKEVDAAKLLSEDVLNSNLSGRDANQLILKELLGKMPKIVGGTADLAPSVKAYVKEFGDYSVLNRKGRNIHFGIREHAMGSICNGLNLYLKSPIFCSTFMAFSNYMLPSIRMAALMNIQTWFMYSHDSFRVGEDGPTHQSIEQLGCLRLIPNLNVFRPCDTRELIGCYALALKDNCPSAFILSKQNLPAVSVNFDDVKKGAYVLSGDKGDVEILASGSEVGIALEVKNILASQDISCVVVSCPCLNAFDKMPEKYKQDVLSRAKKLVSFEASNDNIWYKYIGTAGLKISIEDFGKSAKGKDLEEYYNFTANKVVKKIKNYLKNNE